MTTTSDHTVLQASLRIISGADPGATIGLPLGETMIGRSEDCALLRGRTRACLAATRNFGMIHRHENRRGPGGRSSGQALRLCRHVTDADAPR